MNSPGSPVDPGPSRRIGAHPPQPLSRATASAPVATTCVECSGWPATRYRVPGSKQRLCEECYRKRLAEDSS